LSVFRLQLTTFFTDNPQKKDELAAEIRFGLNFFRNMKNWTCLFGGILVFGFSFLKNEAKFAGQSVGKVGLDSILPNAYAVFLTNPSFEDLPQKGETPTGWYDCGAAGETPPDVQPGYFGVIQRPAEGNTFLGMVVRDNETWEAVGQKLKEPLLQNQTYFWSLHLCQSEFYKSQSRSTGYEAKYDTPVKVRIWGGKNYCEKSELLAETATITNTRWLQYDFKICPKNDVIFLTIEAYYRTPILSFYNGNVLIDDASPFIPVDSKK
jgi:hypothetical protein